MQTQASSSPALEGRNRIHSQLLHGAEKGMGQRQCPSKVEQLMAIVVNVAERVAIVEANPPRRDNVP
jgi:hypothetical protein